MTTRKHLLTTVAAVLAMGGLAFQPAFAADGYGTAETPADIVRPATDVPEASGRRAPEAVRIKLETVELVGRLDNGSSYNYWTFNGKVPGPFVRVRVGDTGLYVYHCAVGPAAQHIANGMYGLILVEPEGGLPPVDREFYVMQGELYTEESFGTGGLLTESYDKLMNEEPEYFVFNGAAEALTGDNALRAKVGETIRIYFGVGGPNKTSSFHVIGEIFDAVYNLGSLTGEPLPDVQTVTVPPGGAVAVDMKLEVPGEFMLVDHALSRAMRGLVGTLIVEGEERPEIFKEGIEGQPEMLMN
jgi:nitrite reductase (NO-forming)